MDNTKGMNGFPLTERTLLILKKHKNDAPTVDAAKSFLYDMPDPSSDRLEMDYRFEHLCRCAKIGETIAKAEGFPVEPFVIAVLLHDVSYGAITTAEEYAQHHLYSADIALPYLKSIGFEGDLLRDMVEGIACHNCKDVLPEGISPFRLSIRDCDNIDALGMIRTARLLGGCVNRQTPSDTAALCAASVRQNCESAIQKTKRYLTYPRGTKTAEGMVAQLVDQRVSLLQSILRQLDFSL